MNEQSASEESFEIADSFAIALMERCDATDMTFEANYHLGELAANEDEPSISIGIFTDIAAIFLTEDRNGTLWLSFKPRDGRCSAVKIIHSTDTDLMIERCIDVLAH